MSNDIEYFGRSLIASIETEMQFLKEDIRENLFKIDHTTHTVSVLFREEPIDEPMIIHKLIEYLNLRFGRYYDITIKHLFYNKVVI
jgi:hypothetical protein